MYLHGHHDSVLDSHRTRTAANSAAYLLPVLQPGMRLLDVGAGAGTITADLAAIVAPGEVVALEPTADLAAIAATEAGRQGRDNVIPGAGDVHALPFPDNSFDVTHAHQVLQHVSDPVRALREMARVTKPGGWVAARDSDYAGFTWYPELPGLDTWNELYHRLARRSGGEPDAGRYFRAWARAADLPAPQFSVTTWCYATPAAVATWSSTWQRRALESAFTDAAREAGVTDDVLHEIAATWREWGEHPDAFLSIPSTELLVQLPAGEDAGQLPA